MTFEIRVNKAPGSLPEEFKIRSAGNKQIWSHVTMFF